jgi:hypothetical protein
MPPSKRRPSNFDHAAKAAQYKAMSDDELGKLCNSKMKSPPGLHNEFELQQEVHRRGDKFFKGIAAKEGKERRRKSDEGCRVL